MMNDLSKIRILPYCHIVGQEQVKLALELAYVAPRRLGGVLISGHRGTGKSTAVRAFAQMVYGGLPVTLPINATEDRVVGGWKIEQLMKRRTSWQPGLLKEANNKLLYIDEVNLLDDHIVSIILDVLSTGVLVVQRDGKNSLPENVSFTLVGTMNPEEGGLRPQLLDRFGLMVNVTAESNTTRRVQILNNVLMFEEAISNPESDWWKDSEKQNLARKQELDAARENYSQVEISDEMLELCIELCDEFKTQGNRGDYILALAARAHAALTGQKNVNPESLSAVAPLVFRHRRQETGQSDWSGDEDRRLKKVLGGE